MNLKQEKLENINFLVISILEMGKFHGYSHEKSMYAKGKSSSLKISNIESQIPDLFDLTPYQPLYSLSQNFKVHPKIIYNMFSNLIQNTSLNYVEQFGINQKMLFEAIEYLELKSLPKNHSLFEKTRI